MKIGIVIYSNDPETVWNALRYANFCLSREDDVKVFFMGKGVEYQKISTQQFNTVEQAERFTQSGGKVYACGTCIKSRQQKESTLCPISTMKDMYDIVKESDRVLTF
jgi:uncharacterized protein involved in oxidation of intracellular sulfur